MHAFFNVADSFCDCDAYGGQWYWHKLFHNEVPKHLNASFFGIAYENIGFNVQKLLIGCLIAPHNIGN